MKKKIAYMMIGAMCTLVLSYGVVAFADQADTSDKDTVAPKSVSVTATAQTQQLNELVEKFTKATSPTANGTFKLDQVKEMEIELKGNHLKLKIELEKEAEAVKYVVEIEQKDEKDIHLKGDEAKQFITQLLAAIGLNESMSKQQFVEALYKKLEVEPANAVTTLELKWKSGDEEGKKAEDAKKAEENKKAQAAQALKAKQALLEQKAKQAQQAKAAKEAQKKAQAEQKAKAAAAKKEQKLQKALQKQKEKLSKKEWLKNGKCDNGRDDDDQGEDHDDDDDHDRDNSRNGRHSDRDNDHEDRNRS